MALGVHAARHGARRALVGWLGLTVALGCAFLAIKAVEYRLDYLEHLVPALDFRYAGPQADQVELFFQLFFLHVFLHHRRTRLACRPGHAFTAESAVFKI
jgi:cytochrome c oxidase subunit III